MVSPKVSILIATFNRAHFLKEALGSIQEQTYKFWECIIVDDGSSDTTDLVVRSFITKDKRFKYFIRDRNYKKGLSGSRNYGLDLAQGDYIIFFDDDDIVHPQNLEIVLEQLVNSQFDFCHYRKQSFSKNIPKIAEIQKSEIDSFRIGPNQLEDVITNKIPLASCTVMWKRKCFKDIRFNESLQYAEEWECYIRILSKGYSGIGIRSTLYFNRKHPNSNTGEFWLGNHSRRDSQIRAVKLVINHLRNTNFLSKTLVRYFVQVGIFLKEFSIVRFVIRENGANSYLKLKYYTLYYFYPVIGKAYRFKKLLIKNG